MVLAEESVIIDLNNHAEITKSGVTVVKYAEQRYCLCFDAIHATVKSSVFIINCQLCLTL